MEQIAPDEAETIAALTKTMRRITETTSADDGHAVRSVHAKSQALLQGELRVLDGLPEHLAQGAFAIARTYPVILRFSTNPGNIVSDDVSTPRGLSIKIVGVPGTQLPDSPGSNQDFVMQNAPAFAAPDIKGLLGSLKPLAASTDKAEGLKKVLSAVLRGAESAIELVGLKSPVLTFMGGHPRTRVLGETFYSMVPLLFGPYIAKVSVAPLSPGLLAQTGAPTEAEGA